MQHPPHDHHNPYSFEDMDLSAFSLDQFDMFKSAQNHPFLYAAETDMPSHHNSPHFAMTSNHMIPFMTPDNSDGGRTGSTLLTAHDPDYVGMSPLQMSPSNLETPFQHGSIMPDDGFFDEEGTFTPLVSPAMTPSFPSLHAHTTNMIDHDTMFSPLASPALHPQRSPRLSRQHNIPTTTTYSPLHSPNHFGNQLANLQQKLANIQQQEQQFGRGGIRASPRSLTSSPVFPPQVDSSNSARTQRPLGKTRQSPIVKPVPSPYEQNPQQRSRKKRTTLHQNALTSSPQMNASMSMPPPMQPLMAGHQVLVSPALKAQLPQQQQSINPVTTSQPVSTPPVATPMRQTIAPATPASLMKLGGGGPSTAIITVSPTSAPAASISLMPAQNLSPPLLPGPVTSPPPQLSSFKSISPNFASPSLQPTARFTPSPALKPLMSPRVVPAGPLGDAMIPITSPLALKPGVTASPRALKPLISPSLKPLLPGAVVLPDAAANILAAKSNYQNLMEGKAQSLGITFSPAIHTGIEIRRTAYKAAEQKRRDSLKQSFENLRKEVLDALVMEPPILVVEPIVVENSATGSVENTVEGGTEAEKDPVTLRKEKEKEVKQMSKVTLLKHSCQYILRLKRDQQHKDRHIARLEREVRRLMKQCGMPEVTEEEQERIKLEEEEEMMARMKREEGPEEDEGEEEDEDGGEDAEMDA
ncbi:hypothetical protein BC938DRAFT_481169 [Jimgerdemannia flammicorona]|uniref:BHLH domain-containing protein n=1 Tax=Jimgerdemannia flammicorona TaxID=994334 RepID=A0A433QGP1_9FUNG|nr:hypothetical protein BC938DRAFT_481169 [Jimgerdemannia flammicorona]